MYSSTTIVGYVGRDGELRYSAKGDPYLHFSIAADRGWGEHKKTVWYRCTVFAKRAETLAPYILKGKLLLVTGELSKPKAYQKNDSSWDASLDLIVDKVKFLGGKREAVEAEQEEIPF